MCGRYDHPPYDDVDAIEPPDTLEADHTAGLHDGEYIPECETCEERMGV